MSKYKLALIQMQSDYLQLKQNLTYAEERIRTAASEGAQVICLPEAFNTGYYLLNKEELTSHLLEAEEQTVSHISQLARELSVYILCPLFHLSEDGRVYNQAIFFDEQGKEIGRYSKSHLIPDEKGWITPGDDFPVWETRYGKIACLICYDICFPETVRTMALKGAELLLIPSAWRGKSYFNEWWDLSLACRALDNLLYIGAVNHIGPAADCLFAGKSKICDPIGSVCAEAGRHEPTIVYADIDPDRIEMERDFNTVMADRRPECYGEIVRQA